MEYALATIWEAISESFGGREALVHGGSRLSWSEFDEQADRLAGSLEEAGLDYDSKVALYLYNCSEYLIGCFAALKLRGVPVNVNYRYQKDELRYLLDNSDAQALVYHSDFSEHIEAILPHLRKLKVLVEVGCEKAQQKITSISFEQAMRFPRLARREKSPDDIILLYTGGTTGLPKGVMHRTGTLSLPFRAGLAREGEPPPSTLDEILNAISDREEQTRFVVPCPLMHGVGWWSAMTSHTRGGCVITLPNHHFDPRVVWQTVEKECASNLCIVGDAFAKPLLTALEEATTDGTPYDLSSLREINSAGAMWSAPVKRAILECADVSLLDAMGASEGGMARQVVRRGGTVETARFELNPSAKVLTEDGREVEPGSGEVGMLATCNNIPLGYYKDPDKTARTFRVVNGVRYAFPGDYAKVEPDGSITLLGRGSNCINSGGEKIYPEEVEEAIKLHPAVSDCLVVGIPDDRFGERVAAVVSLAARESVTEEELIDTVHQRLAGYKAPRHVAIVDEVRRAPNGKPDYTWAREVAVSETQPSS